MAHSEKPTPLKGDAPDVAQAPSLCTDCGLCCTGALNDAGALDPDEVAAAADIGLKLLDYAGRPGFHLPCAKLEGTRCGIFGHRPRVCSRFKCKVLVDLEEQRLAFDQAAAHVRTARELYAAMLEALPDYLTIRDAKLMAKAGFSTPRLHELRLKATALETYLDQHFRKDSDVKMFDQDDGK